MDIYSDAVPAAAGQNRRTQETPAAGNAGTGDEGFKFFGKDGLTFWDVLDVVNPLQHIPVVNTIYRAITGDEIDPAAKLAGGALFGGPVGAAFAAVDVGIDATTGRDAGEHLVAFFDSITGGEQTTATAVAQAGGAGMGGREQADAFAGVRTGASPVAAAIAQNGAAPPSPRAAPTPQVDTRALAAGNPAVLAAQEASMAARGGAARSGPVAIDASVDAALARLAGGRTGPAGPGVAASGASEALQSARTSLAEGRAEADAFAALRYRHAAQPKRDTGQEDARRPAEAAAAAGAIAPNAGWFSQTMMDNLARYQSANEGGPAGT